MNSWGKAAYRILPFLYKSETKSMIEDYLENDDINTFTNKFFRLANRIGIAIKDKPTFTIKEQKAWKDWLESWVPGYQMFNEETPLFITQESKKNLVNSLNDHDFFMTQEVIDNPLLLH